MSVVTRFAPSPTGYLHIGGARTALFNWLYARRMQGRYLLRIEDTDRARSTQPAIDAILDGLSWLGLQHDGEVVYQSARAARHREAAEEMVRRGTAFRCYVTPEELEARRAAGEAAREKLGLLKQAAPAGVAAIAAAQADVERLTRAFRSPCRDGVEPPSSHAAYVIRLRAPDRGDIVNHDLIQGDVRIKADDIDDLVLLRADGSPTYMLSVVVDDHDMGVTHVIRGDDHLTNAARQIPIFQAMGCTAPKFAHVPLIHGEDGKKLSKRHGAQAVHEWRELGYLPEAMCAYLMRLGWSPGHDEIVSKEDAVAEFDLAQIGKAPARLDFAKLASVNAHYMQKADDARLEDLALKDVIRRGWKVSEAARVRLAGAAPVLKKRAKTVMELVDGLQFLVNERPLLLTDAAQTQLNSDMKPVLARLSRRLGGLPNWNAETLSAALKAFATEEGVGLGRVGPGVRAALSGGLAAPDLGQTMELLGREETLARLDDQTR